MIPNQPQNNRMNRRDKQPIIYIMLNRREDSSPTLPPSLFFSVEKSIPALCPPIF